MIKLKICGMRESENINDIAALKPDYIGFIYYKPSKRYVGDTFSIPSLGDKIKKVGVFVDAPSELVIQIVLRGLQAIQLHGNESVDYCRLLKKVLPHIELIKVFSIGSSFDFSILKEYEGSVDYFLFDTKGAEHGGNGFAFDWNILKNYNLTIPYFLSGGIGLNDYTQIKLLLGKTPLYGIDVNSKFEISPALKDVKMLKTFKKELNLK